MIVDLATYAGGALLLLGSMFCLVAAIGVVRLPDLYTRMHAASKAGAVGGGLILLAVALLCFDIGVALRAIIGIVFLLLTTPVGAHLLAKASHTNDDKHQLNMLVDELKANTSPTPRTDLRDL